MNKSILTLAGMIILAGIFMSSSIVYADDNDDDNIVCYQWDIFPNERFKLNVKKHSPLSKKEEEKKFRYPRQTAFSVHGKHVIFETMATVEGSVVTADKTSPTVGPTGAHMDIHSKFVRGDGAFGGFDFARPVTVECTTDEVSATPTTWSCQSRNEFDTYHGFSKLTKVKEKNDPACSIFEDGEFGDIRTTVERIRGPASVLK